MCLRVCLCCFDGHILVCVGGRFAAGVQQMDKHMKTMRMGLPGETKENVAVMEDFCNDYTLILTLRIK